MRQAEDESGSQGGCDGVEVSTNEFAGQLWEHLVQAVKQLAPLTVPLSVDEQVSQVRPEIDSSDVLCQVQSCSAPLWLLRTQNAGKLAQRSPNW